MAIWLSCLSHTPLRGLNDPGADIEADVDAILTYSRRRVEAFDPELIVIFAPDHFNGLFYDLMPPFVLATAARSVGDYCSMAGLLAIPADLALDLAGFVLDADVDIAISHDLTVDHGCAQTLEELTGSLTRYPVIPIIINCVAPPFAPYRRIRKLGEAVGNWAARLGKRVLVVGSGGLSHEPPVPLIADAPVDIRAFLIAGRNPTDEARLARQARTIAAGKTYGGAGCLQAPLNPTWDRQIIDLLASGNLAAFDNIDIAEISRTAGRSAHEIRTWVAAFSALAATGPYAAQCDYYRPINPWIAGYGIVSAHGLTPDITSYPQGSLA